MADTASLAHLNWDGSVLMDREHYLHDKYGAVPLASIWCVRTGMSAFAVKPLIRTPPVGLLAKIFR